METSQDLFKELETAEKLFSDGSIKSAQKIVRNVLKESKNYKKVPNKLRHKINAALSKSRYFDEIFSFPSRPPPSHQDRALESVIYLVFSSVTVGFFVISLFFHKIIGFWGNNRSLSVRASNNCCYTSSSSSFTCAFKAVSYTHLTLPTIYSV